MSLFDSVPLGPTDAILGLTLAFKADTNPNKLNLGVGAYRTEDGKPFVLECVKKAEEIISNSPKFNKEYIPIDGYHEFNVAAANLLFGELYDKYKDQIVTSQSLSGTGAVRVGIEFLKRFVPGAQVYISDPTWPNHAGICTSVGVDWKKYRYYDRQNNNIDFEGMCEDIKNAPEGSIMILHACSHNPTGCDPTPDQWNKLGDILKEKKHIPFMDCAYQGFASGDPNKDAFSIRLLMEKGLEIFVAQSFAKNFGLYGERTGALHIICKDSKKKEAILSQLKLIIRQMYSSPPIHGAFIVATVLSSPELKALWESEVKEMANRLQRMREGLFAALQAKGIVWKQLLQQIGMFGFTGLTTAQVERLTNEHHVYMASNGRISLAGLSEKTIPIFANAVEEVLKSV